ncbi:hypothetical protein DY000_02039165 [Brassica cretica]|uniref:Uncharacterized protein n=1 Tax=Brassica cretica TaxID=69181 RepID=A0ABQ7BJV2_BRACR|nr:hypothetical protein DY000_02039165 [Brassica cretica]
MARLLRSDRAQSKHGRYVATEHTAWLLCRDRAQAKLGRYVVTDHAHGSVAT